MSVIVGQCSRRGPGVIMRLATCQRQRSWPLGSGSDIRTLHPDAMLIHRAAARLLANGTVWRAGGKHATSTGLLAFDMRGQRAFTRFRGADVSVLGSHGRLAYVWVRPTRMLHVLDLRSGDSLRSQRVGPARLPFLFSAAERPPGS
jgi:hypothetical protein